MALICLAVVALLLRLTLFSGPKTGASTPGRLDAPSRPNILIIVTDDQRSSLDVMPKTVRRFVNQGRKFPNASVTTPQCCPSRSSILTGRFAHNHGVLNNTLTDKLNQRTTLEYYLKQQGYRTSIFGKFLNGWGRHDDPPYFDEWAIGPSRTYYDGTYRVNESVKKIHEYSTSYLRQKAIGFIDKEAHRDHPWMMYLAPFAPHNPFVPAKKYAHADVPSLRDNPAIRETDKRDKPTYVQNSPAKYRQRSRTFKAQERTLLSVDDMVGSVFDALHATGQERDTLAFFISDNGLFWGEHGLKGKSAPYLQSVDVPMMVRWPQRDIAGTIDRRLVANIDLAPTILQATGFHGRLTAPMDGRSLFEPWHRADILNEFWRRPGEGTPMWASIRDKRFQYTEYYGAQDKLAEREYYNLSADKWQLHNLLGDSDPTNNPDVRSLHHQLITARACAGTKGSASCP